MHIKVESPLRLLNVNLSVIWIYAQNLNENIYFIQEGNGD